MALSWPGGPWNTPRPPEIVALGASQGGLFLGKLKKQPKKAPGRILLRFWGKISIFILRSRQPPGPGGENLACFYITPTGPQIRAAADPRPWGDYRDFF